MAVVTTYARLGGYGVTWHSVSDICRTTPGHEPQRLTLCGRVIRENERLTNSPPWPLCSVCERVKAS